MESAVVVKRCVRCFGTEGMTHDRRSCRRCIALLRKIERCTVCLREPQTVGTRCQECAAYERAAES